MRVENEETDEMRIERGMRQGCCMSPTRFNFYRQELMNEAVEWMAGLRIGGERSPVIKYAVDQVVLASSEEDFQK